MEQLLVTCPGCGREFQLTDALKEQIEGLVRRRMEEEYRRKEEQLRKEREEMDEILRKKLEERLASEREKLSSQIKEEFKREMMEKEADIERYRKMWEDGVQKELELRNRERELEEKIRTIELEVARRLDEERKRMEESIAKSIEERYALQMKELQEQNKRLTEEIDNLNKKARPLPSELEGEAQEKLLEETLQQCFPDDYIEPVPRGTRGADVIQHVRKPGGKECGIIVWESKRAKQWNEDWVEKLKENLREINGDIAVLVTQAFPAEDGVYSSFTHYRGIYLTELRYAPSVAALLRNYIFRQDSLRFAEMGRIEKESMLYNFITGNEFRHQVESIASAIEAAQKSLEEEQRSLQRIWKKRDTELKTSLLALASMYGKIDGIVGSMPVIPQLELPEDDGE
jgi:hypothetical protein